MSADDLQLVESSLRGDNDAFGELVRRYQDAVFNLAWRMSGNWHEAADIAQDTFLRAHRRLGTYRPAFGFKNWLLSICANLTRNRFRSWQRRRRLEERFREAVEAGFLLAPEPAPPDADLEAALGKLPRKLRAAVVLKYMEDLPYEDVARVLGISVSAAKMRVARGRLFIQRLMERGECHEPKR